MASIKVLLWSKKNKDGLYPIAIRIIKDRKPSYVYLGHYIKKADWDEREKRVKKSHPNSAKLNNLISQKMAEASGKLLDLEVSKTDTSSKTIKKSIRSANHSQFFQQADLYLDSLKQNGKYNRYNADKPRIERLREFIKDCDMGTDVSFAEITAPFLNRFRAFLKSTRKVGERTIINHLIVIRTIFNQAISSNIVDRKYYPFGRGKILIKFPETIKIGLSPKEVKILEEIQLEKDSYLNHCRNLWLISFYFAGMRISDTLRLKWSDFQNDRLHYSMGKNAKAGSLKTPEKALRILEQYKRGNPTHDLVFPELEGVQDINNLYEVQQRISSSVRKLDQYLPRLAKIAEINKKLTMHIARHTFGNISGDRIPIQMLQRLYRHTSITTTIGYQANFIHKDADEALNAVLGF